MMNGESCGTCLYWINHQCHRHAPMAVLVPQITQPEARWPWVSSADWCGDYARMETTHDD
jgi:hypothetical protein